jgi:hypothetical protein
MARSLEERLNDITKQIDEVEFNLRVCSRHTQFMHEMKKVTASDKNLFMDYDRQMGQDAYKRMMMQEKLKKLMEESFELQEKILNGEENE